jgi:cytochrome P450
MTKPLDSYNFFDPQLIEDPFAFYQDAIQQSPVWQLPGTNIFLVTSYELVAKAADTPAVFSNRFGDLLTGRGVVDEEIKAVLAKGWPQTDTLLTADPPVHTRFRKLVNLAFSAPKVNAMEDYVRSIATDLINEIAPKGQCEFVHDFAVKLPVAVIAEVLGDSRTNTALFKRWSDAFADRLGGMASRERELECAHEVVEFQHYFKKKIDERRANPEIKDMTADLVHARIEGEQPLTDAEILSILQQLMVAGNETTTNTMSGALLLLIQNPGELAKLEAEPKLIPNMVEEALRLESATSGMWRVVLQDTDLGGVTIPAKSMLHIRYAAANRDPVKYADPDAFVVDRQNARTHMAFGRGIHMCIGNMLSRKELTLAFQELLGRLTNFALVPGANDFTHISNLMLRGLKHLHVSYSVRG